MRLDVIITHAEGNIRVAPNVIVVPKAVSFAVGSLERRTKIVITIPVRTAYGDFCAGNADYVMPPPCARTCGHSYDGFRRRCSLRNHRTERTIRVYGLVLGKFRVREGVTCFTAQNLIHVLTHADLYGLHTIELAAGVVRLCPQQREAGYSVSCWCADSVEAFRQKIRRSFTSLTCIELCPSHICCCVVI